MGLLRILRLEDPGPKTYGRAMPQYRPLSLIASFLSSANFSDVGTFIVVAPISAVVGNTLVLRR